MSSLNLVRLGALGALLAGVAWTVLGLVDTATLGGRGSEALNSAFLEATLYLAALASTLGGIVGLHARQTPNYGRLGTAGFLATFTGTAILLGGLVLSFLVGGLFGAAFLDPVLGAALWCVLVGFVLLGATTLRLEALPRWCGVALIFGGVSSKSAAGSSPSGTSTHNSPPSIPARALHWVDREDPFLGGWLVSGRELSVTRLRLLVARFLTATGVPRVRTRELASRV